MADIELVIKIPEELYVAYKGRPPMLGDAGMDMIAQAIANGTPIPKGHGRIVDISKLQYMKTLNEAVYNRLSWVEAIRRIKNSAPTIVEADGEGEEEK